MSGITGEGSRVKSKTWGEKPYTRRGDDGSTGLLYGSRVSKDDLAPEAYGAVDEACAALGLARAAAGDGELADMIKDLQRELFIVGAELATAPENQSKLEPGKTAVTDAMVKHIEAVIDGLLETVDPPREFVLPGQDACSASLDLARAIIRRAERRAVTMQRADRLPNASVVAYLNRVSDLIYMLARWREGDDYERLGIF